MDPLAETLNEKLQQWRPEVADLVRELVAEVIRLADENKLDTFKRPRRLGFMKGQMRVPEDFDTMCQDEIAKMFYGEEQ